MKPEVLRERIRAKLIAVLDPSLYPDVGRTVDIFLDTVFVAPQPRGIFHGFPFGAKAKEPKMRIVFPSGDPAAISKAVMREGTPLTAKQKKDFGIRGNAKYGDAVLQYFTPAGLPRCGIEAETISQFIFTVLSSIDNLNEMRKDGEKEVMFVSSGGEGEPCEKLAGKYPISKVPIPGLDTHVGCTCCLTFP